MSAFAIWAAYCGHMAHKCRAFGMDAAAAQWTLASDFARAIDELQARLAR